MLETEASINALFGWASQAAMVGWLFLVFAPRRWSVIRWIPKFLIPFGLSLVYAILALTSFFEGAGDFGSFGGVRRLFESDQILLAGWIHYLAFDLFVGAWIAERADRLGISRVIQPVFFAATFMFGPLGLALFLIVHAFYSPRGNPV